jgi:hypothetical protein
MPDARLLRAALLANAAFSTGCGLLLLLAPGQVGDLLGLEVPRVLQAVGLGLLVFAADLVHQATRSRLATWRALYASAGDLLWVAGTFVGLLAFPNALSGTGIVVVLLVAAVVLLFGALQLRGIDRAHRVPGTDRHRHCIVVWADAPAAAMWSVVGRLGDIARYMPALESSEILDGRSPGVGAVRRCVDRDRKEWSEECVEYRPGRSFVVRFLAEAPGFPFPATSMEGGWEVRPAGEASEVVVWWELVPKPRPLAPLLLPVLALRADRDFTAVVARMAASVGGSRPRSPGQQGLRGLARLLPRPC